MTPEMEMIVKRVGKDAIEVFNIAHHHSKGDPPCVCNVCQNCYDKISLWLRDHDAGVAVQFAETLAAKVNQARLEEAEWFDEMPTRERTERLTVLRAAVGEAQK